MNDTTRTVLIALGVALLVAVLLPLLFMAAMMGGGMMGGGMMGGGMMGGGMMGGGGAWAVTGLALLVLLAGGVLLALGLRRR